MAVSRKTAIRRNARKRMILEIIRNTPAASRAVVQKLSGLSMDSTLGLIDELLRDGLIVSMGKSDDGKVGRKATLLKINSEGRYFVGLRFNAGSAVGVVINFDRQVVLRGEWRAAGMMTAKEMVDFLGNAVEELLSGLGKRRERVSGIGIGAPGIIDPKKGMILRYVHIPDWKDVDLKHTFEARFGIPTFVEHGVKCAARAMMTLPEHVGCGDMLYTQLDRGISMCIVANGQIYNGASYLSGEIGHIHAEDNGIRCDCGRIGCLETVASDSSILSAAKAALDMGRCGVLRAMLESGAPLWVSTLCEAERNGDADCAALLAHTGRSVGNVMAAAVGLLNPRQLMLVGWMTSSPAFQKSVRQSLGEHCLDESLNALTVFFTGRDNVSDARGAAELPYTKQFDSRESVAFYPVIA